MLLSFTAIFAGLPTIFAHILYFLPTGKRGIRKQLPFLQLRQFKKKMNASASLDSVHLCFERIAVKESLGISAVILTEVLLVIRTLARNLLELEIIT